MEKVKLSIVVPLYKCEPFIKDLCIRVIESVSVITPDFEIILVNDNSPMKDWTIVKEESEKDKRIKGINLSRNFGQHYAITAGLNSAKGDWIVVMDGDLQDRPEEVTNLYTKAKEGYDIVLARREERQDSFLKRKSSEYFYKILAYLTETEQNSEVANFGIYHRSVVNAINSMNDQIKYFPAMVRWVGFNRTEISVEHVEREHGESSYSYKALLSLALSVILSFSDKPLRLIVKMGLLTSGLSFLFALFTLYKTITGQISVIGYSSLIISIWFLSGIVITLLGMLGLYIGRIFDQVKDRPVYIISETTNL